LAAIIEDGRASVETLSERVGLSPTPVRNRIKRLERDGIIKGYTAVVDLAACGLSLTLYAFVRLRSMDLGLTQEFERQIQLTPEVRTCHMVTGSYSHIMVMQLEDIADYNSYLRERLSKLPGVASIQTQVVIDTIKEDTDSAVITRHPRRFTRRRGPQGSRSGLPSLSRRSG